MDWAIIMTMLQHFLQNNDIPGKNIPGFYNGDHEWIVRFCPSLEGNWSYETYSSVPSLAGRKGTVSVSGNTKSGRHGPVTISRENRRKFVYEDGTPYLLMAFQHRHLAGAAKA